MPAKQFFNFDINKLFEEYSIKDIEQIQKTIQLESDRKKIELRTLVGERYRDLIQAADTIAEMRETSENVIGRIAEIETTFRDLQRKYVIGFKMESSETSSGGESQKKFDSIVMQIKILMDIPEHIWSAIDNRDFLLASQLFILAQHVNYSLTFEVGQALLSNKYPIVAKQWSVVGHFRNVIFNECNDTLQSLDLSAEVAANCLAALVLLDGTSSKDLLDKLISLRSQAVESIIKDENPRSVRHRIKMSLKLLTDAVVLIHSCFIETHDRGRGLVAEYVSKLTNQRASSMLKNLDLDSEMLEKFLPTSTKNHMPFEKEQFVDLDPNDLRIIIENWLRRVEETTNTEISRLLNLVTSIRGIFNIREESLALDSPGNWNVITAELSLGEMNFWTKFYQPLLTKRVKEIIGEKWSETMKNLRTTIGELLTKIAGDKYEYPENDLRWYVWKDSTSDIPRKLDKIAASDAKRSLLAKSRGFTPNLIDVCDNFDKSLNDALIDLERYLYESETIKSTKNNLLTMTLSSVYDKFTDRAEIQENLQNVSSTMIEDFAKFSRREYLVDDTKFGRSDVNMIFFARFYQALTIICPCLNRCFTLSKITGHPTSCNVKWQIICDRLRDESGKIWSNWAERYGRTIKEHRARIFNSDEKKRCCIDDFISEWEKIVIEEEGEEGKSMKSEIFVPYQASANLQKFVSTISRDINKIIPHTLPKRVIHGIVENVAAELFDHYDEMARNSDVRQKQAFQVLFDIKYVTMLMVPRDNKSLVDRSTRVSNNVLAKIDPFDSDVFYPFIHVNVKKSVQRSLLIYGNLVPHIEQLHSVLGSRSDYTSSDSSRSMTDPPGGLAICTGAPWFPALAVTAPTKNLPLMTVSVPEKTQRKKMPARETTKNDFSGATIKSGAAAFFGAMGSDWFGTG